MTRLLQPKRHRPSIEEQLALANRVLNGLHKSLDETIEQMRDLEVKRAIALYKSGKATLQDADEIMRQARRRIALNTSAHSAKAFWRRWIITVPLIKNWRSGFSTLLMR